jgi:hypothetical protein
MSNEQTTSYARYQALRQAISDAVFLAECHRFEYTGSLDDSAEIGHDELWSALAQILVIHAQPHATRAATDAAILDYVAACIAQHGEAVAQ